MSVIGALGKFKDLMAASATWQSITGSANATEAKAKIYSHTAEPRPTPPFAVVEIGEATTEIEAFGAPDSHRGEVTFEVTVELAPTGADIPAKYEDAWTDAEDIREEILELSGTGTYYQVQTLSIDFVRRSGNREGDTVWLFKFYVTGWFFPSNSK